MTDDAIAASVQRLAAGGRSPRIAVLLGSGWGGFVERIDDALELPYAELPAFPAPGVGGHAGRVRLGRIGRHEVMVLAGRRHAYEGGDAGAMKGAIRTLAALGVSVLVQTNAAGSLDPALPPGSLMAISDHLNIAQRSPLVGDESGDARFVDMSDAYDAALRAQAAALAGIGVAGEGVYAWVLGPQFETPAEIRMLQRLGASAVGMSTVPETILARHAGLRVLAYSLITNWAAGIGDETLSHASTLASAHAAGERAGALLAAVVGGLEP
jgi:purine-nucleoside phosphorylase